MYNLRADCTITSMKKTLTQDQFYQTHLFGNAELMACLLSEEGIKKSEVQRILYQKALDHLSDAECKAMFVDENTPHSKERALFGSIAYVGEYPRRFRQNGFDLVKESTSARYNSFGFWKLKKSENESEKREAIPKKAWTVWAAITNKCSLTGLAIDGKPEMDHRAPILRTRVEVALGEDSSDQQIIETFQPVSQTGNLIKREKCNSCVRTNKRPGGTTTGQAMFWYRGDENFDPIIGCDGCFWYDPTKWMAHLNHPKF